MASSSTIERKCSSLIPLDFLILLLPLNSSALLPNGPSSAISTSPLLIELPSRSTPLLRALERCRKDTLPMSTPLLSSSELDATEIPSAPTRRIRIGASSEESLGDAADEAMDPVAAGESDSQGVSG